MNETHDSDCAQHNEPASPNGPCDCSVSNETNQGGERDYPAEFEAWWATYQHRNRLVADYPIKKQIAFDAFYFAARQPSPREQPEPVAWGVIWPDMLEPTPGLHDATVSKRSAEQFVKDGSTIVPLVYAKPSKQTGGGGETVATEIAERVVLAVCELPDRTSPEDWPEAMLVTGEELHHLVYDAILAALSTNEVA